MMLQIVAMPWSEMTVAAVFVVAGLIFVSLFIRHSLPRLMDSRDGDMERLHASFAATRDSFERSLQRCEQMVDAVISEGRENREHCTGELETLRQHNRETHHELIQAINRYGDRLNGVLQSLAK